MNIGRIRHTVKFSPVADRKVNFMKYTADWKSIDSREVPEWFKDAKFGIFIHWGLYSAPAFGGPVGEFTEWYWYFLNRKPNDDGINPYVEYHKKTYGENAQYEDLVAHFKAENFNAEEWVSLFQKAGAKYMNLVSKHHDGFCMYPTKYAWNWNSMDVGPHRDFCRELKDACDKSDVKFGVYHSLYEWYHPLYLENPEKYALEHLIPMLKELITKYEPATLFTDGEWDHPSEVWHSTEFLAWLYNESPVKDYIVPNDRWGKETRGSHGGNFTTEYGVIGGDLENTNPERTTEECRGIGTSFGYNRFEKVEDYMSGEALIKMLVDLVSRGSNFLLNVGPTADGRIPVIMEERLLEIGEWLNVNSDGIYGTRKYCVKDEGDIRYTKKGNTIYAFVMKYPFGEIVLEDVEYKDGLTATLFGYDGEIKVENADGKVCLSIGAINPDLINSKYVYGFKLEEK